MSRCRPHPLRGVRDARRLLSRAFLALLLLWGAGLLMVPQTAADALTISIGAVPADKTSQENESDSQLEGAKKQGAGGATAFDEPDLPDVKEADQGPKKFDTEVHAQLIPDSIMVMLHFKDADLETVDFASYQAPVTLREDKLVVQVTDKDSSLSFRDALKFSVYDHYATFDQRQTDITQLCGSQPEDGTVTIPLDAFEDSRTLALVYWLSPLHPAYQRFILNELDTTDQSLRYRGHEASLRSDVSDVLVAARGEKGMALRARAPLGRQMPGFPGEAEKHYQINTYTHLENFDVDMTEKQKAYGFPSSMVGSYGFGVFFGACQHYENGVCVENTWDDPVLRPSSVSYSKAVNDYLGDTIAGRLGSKAEFALSRNGEQYRSRYLTKGVSFQDAGYSPNLSPTNKAMAHGTCGSSGVINGVGAIIMDNAGDNYIAYKGVYHGAQAQYDGWYKFFYKFDAKSASTGQNLQDVVGYVLAPPVKTGRAQAIKVSANPALSNANSRYSLEHAVIAVYADRDQAQAASDKAAKKPWGTWQEARDWAQGRAAFTFITKSDGKSNIVEDLEIGTYYAAELFAPKGYRLYTGVKSLTVEVRSDDANPDTVTFVDDPQRGAIDLVKVSANPPVDRNSPCYSLAGAIYTVYSDAACLNPYGTMTVALDSTGKATARMSNVPIGPYWVRETTRPSKGFGIDERTYPVTVVDGETTRVNTTEVSDPPKLDPITIMLRKLDRQTMHGVPQGGASLGDAQFRICYYAAEDATLAAVANLTPAAIWVVRTNDQGVFSLQQAEGSFEHQSTRGPRQTLPYKVSGPSFFRLRNGSLGMPIGTYTIQETKAPEGYLLDSTVHLRHIRDEASNSEILANFQAEQADDRVTELVVRSDARFVKRANGSSRLAGIPFKLTSKTTGEWHVIVTGKNGFATTQTTLAKPHSLRTNTNDAQFRQDDGTFALPDQVNMAALDAGAGIWFGGMGPGEPGAPVDNAQGALPFDVYQLDELRCPANHLFSLIHDEIIIDAEDQGEVIDLGTLNNTVEGTPAIHTEAYNGLTGNLSDHEINAEPEALIIDRVSFSGLTPGEEYQLEAVLMDRETGEPYHAGDQEVRTRVSLTPQATSGFANVPLPFDASGVTEATQLVVFETLFHDDDEVASHLSLEDAKQTITARPVAIETSARDKATGAREALLGQEALIVDTVRYRGLTPGRTYTMQAVLMDANTGEAFTSEGKSVSTELDFTPDTEAGEIDMELPVATEELTETTALVVFETLYFNEAQVALHADLNNGEQTVVYRVPEPDPEPDPDPEPPEPPSDENPPTPEEPETPAPETPKTDKPKPSEPQKPPAKKTGTPLSQTGDDAARIARWAGAALAGSALVLTLALVMRWRERRRWQ